MNNDLYIADEFINICNEYAGDQLINANPP